MIADALRYEVEKYGRQTLVTNPLFIGVRSGRVRREGVAVYLHNLHFLISHSVPHLSRAAARSRALGREELAAHFDKKLAEEEGHEVWAEQDLANVRSKSRGPAPFDTVPAVRDLVRFVSEVIEEDPALYLAYILLAEYTTVLIGPAWLAAVEEHCGVERASMTVVSKHVALDVDHTEEALEAMDDLVADPRRLPRLRQVMLHAMSLLDRLCAEVVDYRHPHAAAPAA